MYDKEISRKRAARIKAALPIKKALIDLGARPTNDDLIICFAVPKYIKPRGNIWTYKNKVYIRWSNLGPKDVPRIKELLDIKKIPSKNPLRRKLIQGLMRDQISIDEFKMVIK